MSRLVRGYLTKRSSYRFLRVYGGLLCIYCGQRKQCWDHGVPLRYAGEEAISGLRLLRLPACLQCNGIVGQVLHRTIGDRRRFAQDRLRELKGSGWRERVDWRNSESIDAVVLAENGLRCIETGEFIVRRFVGSELPAGAGRMSSSDFGRPLVDMGVPLTMRFRRRIIDVRQLELFVAAVNC